MRWIPFLVLCYLATALQTARLGGFPVHSEAPGGGGGVAQFWPAIEYLPLLAVFYAMYAMESAGPLAALICGAAYDVANGDYVGTSLVPLALTGWLIVRVRLSIFREHFLSQMVVTLLAILCFGVFSAVFRKMIGAHLEGGGAWGQFGTLAGNAVYTAAVAPFLFFLMFRLRGLLGFGVHGPRARMQGRG